MVARDDKDIGEVEGDSKEKRSWLKIVLLVLGLILVVATAIGSTLYMTGYFDSEPQADSAAAKEIVEDLQRDREQPQEATPREQKPVQLYEEMSRNFTANLANSKRYVQFSLAVMTLSGQSVVDSLKQHEMAIRSAILMQVSTYTEDQLITMEDKKKVTAAIRQQINQELRKYAETGGIDEVYFTEFIIQ